MTDDKIHSFRKRGDFFWTSFRPTRIYFHELYVPSVGRVTTYSFPNVFLGFEELRSSAIKQGVLSTLLFSAGEFNGLEPPFKAIVR